MFSEKIKKITLNNIIFITKLTHLLFTRVAIFILLLLLLFRMYIYAVLPCDYTAKASLLVNFKQNRVYIQSQLVIKIVINFLISEVGLL